MHREPDHHNLQPPAILFISRHGFKAAVKIVPLASHRLAEIFSCFRILTGQLYRAGQHPPTRGWSICSHVHPECEWEVLQSIGKNGRLRAGIKKRKIVPFTDESEHVTTRLQGNSVDVSWHQTSSLFSTHHAPTTSRSSSGRQLETSLGKAVLLSNLRRQSVASRFGARSKVSSPYSNIEITDSKPPALPFSAPLIRKKSAACERNFLFS